MATAYPLLTPFADSCAWPLQAVNVAGAGPFSDVVLCQTPCSVPAAVSNIYALQRYETSQDTDEEEEDEDSGSQQRPLYSPSTCLRICWDPPCDHGSDITSYLIDLGERQPIVIGPVTRHVIQHLQPDTSYRLVFHTVNSTERICMSAVLKSGRALNIQQNAVFALAPWVWGGFQKVQPIFEGNIDICEWRAKGFIQKVRRKKLLSAGTLE